MRATLYYSPNLNPRLCVAVARYLGADLDYVAIASLDADRKRRLDN